MIKATLQGAQNINANVEKATVGGSGGTTDHSALFNLDYEHSGHTGFASEASLTALEGQIPHDISQLNDDIGVATKSGVEAQIGDLTEGIENGTIVAAKASSATTADTSTMAQQDSEGNDIVATYATKKALEDLDTLPNGGTTGQFLQKTDDGTAWADIDLSGKADTNGTYPNMTVGNATNATTAQSATTATSATTAETATNATNATHAINADKATSDVEGNAILSTYAKLTALNEINATLQEVQETANEAEAIARGKATSYTFETLTALDDWLEVPANVAKLHIGDNLYINDVGVPDYWWNGEARMILESEKPDMSNYYSKDEIDTKLAQKANTGGTYSSMSVGFATTAQSAENATHATSADTATSATTAQSATKAESATNATNAVNATTATNAGHATTADSATKATQDGDGNVISTTYVKVNQIPSAEITKQDIADALGCTTSQLDIIVALAQKITVSDSEIVASVRVTAPEFNDN